MTKVRNIIFDFGGVIINIDTSRVGKLLAAKGIDNLDNLHMHLLSNNIYFGLETGHVSEQKFRDEIKRIIGSGISDREIDDAWNAIILDIPPQRVRLLENIRKNYSTYLLSNTNIIHFNHYNRYFAETFGYGSLAELFEKAYFSHEMGLRKPDPNIYNVVLKDSGLNPGETLFIDDNKENVAAAIDQGILGYHLIDGKELTDLFIDDLLAIDL
jgi:putative hydrolase of the HAD superfamily